MSSSRKKSCQECRVAKARCDLLVPSCTRCLERRKPCQYDKGHAPLRLSSRRSKAGKPTANANMPSHSVEVAIDDNQRHSLPSDHLDLDCISLEQSNNNDWLFNDISREMDSSVIEPTPISGPDLLSQDWSSFSALPCDIECPITRTTNPCIEYLDRISYDLYQMKTAPLGPVPAQILTSGLSSNMMLSSRSKHAAEATLTVSMVVGRVNHFPRMIVEGPCLPPFIHPRCVTRGLLDTNDIRQIRNQFLEPLAICASIIHMYTKKTVGSTSFIMRTIQAEQLRLLEDYARLDNQTLLAALQALVTYLILQALESETWKQPSTICVGVRAIFEISQKLLLIGEDGFTTKSKSLGQTPTWEEWAFFESHRRTINLLYLLQQSLNSLTSLYSDMKIPCQGYDKVPLPCAHSLWTADARIDWEREYQQRIEDVEDARVLRIGFISRVLDIRQEASEFLTLQKWCSELDEFGSLVWTTARVRTV